MTVTADKVVVELQAKVDGYQANVQGAERAFTGSMGRIGSAAEGAEKKISHSSVNVRQALKDIFDSSRLALVEEGSTKLRVFGSAIEPLGGFGIAAAVGVVALFAAIEESHKFAEFAEDIEKTSKALGISTTHLQEFDFIATATGISIDTMQASLKAGNEALGAFQSNIGDERTKRAFAALGITKEQARSFDNIGQALPLIADKIKALGSTAEQAKIAEALGLGNILPALQKGSEGFADLTAEAHRYGIVLNEDVIKRGAQAAEKMNVASKVIDGNLKSAFADIAPIIAAASLKLAEFVHLLTQVDPKRLQQDLRGGIAQAQARIDAASSGTMAGGFSAGGLSGLTAAGRARLVQEQTAKRDALQARLDGLTAPQTADPKGHAKALAKERGGGEDQTAALSKEAQSALDKAAIDYIAALKSLTEDIQQRADAGQDEIAAELAKTLNELDAQAAKIKASKLDSAKRAQLEEINQAKSLAQQTADIKGELLRRQTINALADKEIAYRQSIDRYLDDIDSINIAMAVTAKDRLAFELKSLANRKAEEDRQIQHDREQELNNDPGHAEQINNRYDALQGAHNDLYNRQVGQTKTNGQSPLGAYLKQVSDDGAALDDRMQSIEVRGLQSLNDQLTEAVMHSKTLGEALHNVFQQVIADVVKLGLEQAVIEPLGQLLSAGASGGFSAIASGVGHLFGRAAGGDVVAGVPYRVNENRMEGFVPAQSGKIVPLGAAAGRGGGGVTVIQPFHFHAEGAVLTSELLGQANAQAAAYARQAGANAISTVNKAGPARLARNQQLGT